jgi:hypothetical protein
VPDAFQHDGAGVADRVEGVDPGIPVDGAEAGGLVGVVAAVIVVDVGGAQPGSGGEGLGGGRRGDVGMAGVQGQRQLGAVQLGQRSARSAIRLPGWTPGGMFSTQTTTPVPRAWSANSSRPRASAARRGPAWSGSESPPGWTTRHVPPASRNQSTHRRRSSRPARRPAGSGWPRSTRAAGSSGLPSRRGRCAGPGRTRRPGRRPPGGRAARSSWAGLPGTGRRGGRPGPARRPARRGGSRRPPWCQRAGRWRGG